MKFIYLYFSPKDYKYLEENNKKDWKQRNSNQFNQLETLLLILLLLILLLLFSLETYTLTLAKIILSKENKNNSIKLTMVILTRR